MDKSIYDAMIKSLDTAKEKLNQASYLSECGSNPGLRQMNSNKAEWLKWVIYLAEHGLKAIEEEERLAAEQELTEEEDKYDGWTQCKECLVTTETRQIIELKNELIKDLIAKTEDLMERLTSLQLTYDCEVECYKTLVRRALIDRLTEVSEFIHDRCWLDGADLVCSVEHLDRCLLELIKE